MTKHRTRMNLFAVIIFLIAVQPTTVKAQEPIPVVATFSVLGDMVERIGGSEVAVSTLVGRNGDTHVYQPTPADAKALKNSEILFTNGLEFEGWLERLAEAADFDGVTVVATDGMELIAMDDHDDEHHDDHDDHAHGEFDPHGWLSLQNAITYFDNITAALATAVPEKAATFYENRATYVTEIELLNAQIKAMIDELPQSSRTVVTSHDAFQYFGRDYQLTFLAPQGLSTDNEASAHDVAQLIEQIRAEGIAAVFVESVADPRLVEQIAAETGTNVGGELFPGALSDEEGPAATYLELMHHNATTIITTLAKKL